MDEPTCTHCWHRKDNITYTSSPPQWDEVCCYCGWVRRVWGQDTVQVLDGHGRFAPRLINGIPHTDRGWPRGA